MIVISKDRIYHEYFSENMKVSTDIAKADQSILRYMTEVVVVDEDVTVEDLVRHMIDYQEDIEFAMQSSLGGYPIQPFLDEIVKETPPEDHLIYAEFCHEASLIDDTTVFATRFGAMGKDVIGGTEEILAYTLELAPISAYKHLRIVLNRELAVTKTSEVEGKSVETVLYISQKEFTLQELLHAFLFEISYYGTPDMRSSALREVIQAVGQNDVYLNSAQLEHLRNEEIAKLEAELAESVKNEDYEKSAELRDKIAQLMKRDPGTNGHPAV